MSRIHDPFPQSPQIDPESSGVKKNVSQDGHVKIGMQMRSSVQLQTHPQHKALSQHVGEQRRVSQSSDSLQGTKALKEQFSEIETSYAEVSKATTYTEKKTGFSAFLSKVLNLIKSMLNKLGGHFSTGIDENLKTKLEKLKSDCESIKKELGSEPLSQEKLTELTNKAADIKKQLTEVRELLKQDKTQATSAKSTKGKVDPALRKEITEGLQKGENVFRLFSQKKLSAKTFFEAVRSVEIPPNISATERANFVKAQAIAETAVEMLKDKYKDEPVTQIAIHRFELFKQGVTKDLPSRLQFEGKLGDGVLKDENGARFDNIRTNKEGTSVTQRFYQYVDQHGGSSATIQGMLGGQAGDSWSPGGIWLKGHAMQERSVPMESYYVRPEAQETLAQFSKGQSSDQDKQSYYMLRALNMEMLSQIELPDSTPDKKHVLLFRTESDDVISRYGLKVGQSKAFKRGPMESMYCGFNAGIMSMTSDLTAYRVPIHRVGVTYLLGGTTPGSCCLFADYEREFTVSLEGLEATYLGKVKGDPSTEQRLQQFRQDAGLSMAAAAA